MTLIPGQAVFGVGRKGPMGGSWADAKYAKRCEAAGCGQVFVPVYANARFCSSACRQRAYRARKRAAAVKP
jgi:hypothetical protein